MDEQARKKALETKRKNLKQVALLEETETHIVIDYQEKKLRLYTSRATVMNRLERAGYKYTKQDTVDGQIWSISHEFDTREIGNFLRTSIFKFD